MAIGDPYYFSEKSSTALSLLLLRPRDVDGMVSAWREVALGWPTWQHPVKPDFIIAAHRRVEQALANDGQVGPEFGGKHVGTWTMSLNLLPEEELAEVFKNMLEFVNAARCWLRHAMKWDGD